MFDFYINALITCHSKRVLQVIVAYGSNILIWSLSLYALSCSAMYVFIAAVFLPTVSTQYPLHQNSLFRYAYFIFPPHF